MNDSENKQLLNGFLNRTFFKDFKEKNQTQTMFGVLELQLTAKCNLNCRYCYYNHENGNGDNLNPKEIATHKNIKNNCKSLFNYFFENNYYPKTIEIFGGELLHQSITFDVLDKILTHYCTTDRLPRVVIPSNMSFLRSDKLTKRVISYISKFRACGGDLCISASVDGIYMDKTNRPVACVDNQDKYYNDVFYNKLFLFAKEYGCGFHPMIHYNNIEKWKDNFLWFQSKFDEYDIDWTNIYLLEVRDSGWTKKTIKQYGEFYKFILNFAFKKLNKTPNLFLKGFIFNGIDKTPNIPRMNMFNNMIRTSRGLGCSFQSTLSVRLGDLTVNGCHRLAYDHYNGFKFVKNENGKIIDIKPLNLPFYLATMSLDAKTFPYCESCSIKPICGQQCLGSQFESMGDPFIPIPSVCLLQFEKVISQIKFLKEHDMFGSFLTILSNNEQILSYEHLAKHL